MLIGPIPTILSHCKSFQWVENTWQSLMGYLSVVKAVFLWGEGGFPVLHISLAACTLCALSGSWMWAFNHPASILLCHCDFFFLFLNGFKISEWNHLDFKVSNINHRDLEARKTMWKQASLSLCIFTSDCWLLVFLRST